jgi:protein kinase X
VYAHTLLQQVGVKAKDLIKKLLVIDRTKRLGCIKGGGRAVREHKWFDGLDWDALYEGKLEVHQQQLSHHTH